MIVNIFGVAAALISIVNFAPQASVVFKRASRNLPIHGMSETGLVILTCNMAVWCMYGMLTNSAWQVIATSVSGSLCLLMAIVTHTVNHKRMSTLSVFVISATVTLIVMAFLSISNVDVFSLNLPSAKDGSLSHIIGSIGTASSTAMFLPQTVKTVVTIKNGDPSDLTITAAFVSMILTPGTWFFYGLAVPAIWTTISCIPQLIQGSVTIGFLIYAKAVAAISSEL